MRLGGELAHVDDHKMPHLPRGTLVASAHSPHLSLSLFMHVGLNLIYLVPGDTGGMEVYARELIPELVRCAPPGTRFTAFVSREAAATADGPWGELLPAVTVPVHARRREQWVLGEQALLPRLATRAGVDLVHSLASTAPAWGHFRRVLTVHDLIYARFPSAHPGLRDRGMRVLVPLAARRSTRVIAISDSTRRDLIELLRLPPALIDVVPQGLGAVRRLPRATEELGGRESGIDESGIEESGIDTPTALSALSAQATRARFDLGERRVLLTLSAKRPHKNLIALIGALARIPSERRPVLVLPGYPTWHEAELRARAAALGVLTDVRFEGWLSEGEIEGLWGLADAFVYPSLYEGFGLPVLEAMARGVPVACADTSSLPEVAGDAALLFDPRSEPAIAQAVERLLGDPLLARDLRERGLARARLFGWERTARLTLDCYARALGCPL
jgi:glycosyltransferase involved in cell wall biosynthesis